MEEFHYVGWRFGGAGFERDAGAGEGSRTRFFYHGLVLGVVTLFLGSLILIRDLS